MVRRAHRLLPALAACAIGLAALVPAAAGAAPTGLLAGVNIGSVTRGAQFREADEQIAAAAQMHAALVRVEVPWSTLEPHAAGQLEPGPLAYTDRLAQDAAAHGIRLVMLVESTPCWASSAPARIERACQPLNVGAAGSWAPRRPADYAAFTAYLAARYGPRLAAIEVWNEPDQSNEEYFAGPRKAARYAALLRAAYPAIKAADPSVVVLGGSLVGSNGAFLRALYAAGAKGYYDGLSVHYYNLTLASVRSIHEAQLAAGDHAPLWLDEFGWSSCWPRRIEQEQACVTPAVQAANLVSVVRSLAGAPYVAAAVVYKLEDSAGEAFGLVTRRGERKPAFRALAALLPAIGGRPAPVTLALHAHGASVVASGSAPVGDFMELEAFLGPVLRYRAFFVLDRFNRFSIRLPSVLGTQGLRVRVFQYWYGPPGAAERTI